jgi:tol-pal system protein YbgF
LADIAGLWYSMAIADKDPDPMKSRPIVRALGGAALLAAALASAPASAQIFGGLFDRTPVPPADVQMAQSTPEIYEQSMRIGRVEEQMRTLTGQVEQLNHTLQLLQQQLQVMQEDNEFRFQQVEGGSPPPQQPRSEAPAQPTTSDIASARQPTPGISAASDSRDPLVGTLQSGSQGFVSAGLGTVSEGAGAGPLDLSAAASGVPSYDAPAAGMGVVGTLPGVSAPDASAGLTAPPQVAMIMAPADPQQAYDEAYGYLTSGDYGMAERSFGQFVADHPTSPLTGNAQYWLGETQYAQGRYREAADAFLETYRSFPDSPKAPDSLLRLGQSLVQLGQDQAACATWGELISKFPASTPALMEAVENERARAGCA